MSRGAGEPGSRRTGSPAHRLTGPSEPSAAPRADHGARRQRSSAVAAVGRHLLRRGAGRRAISRRGSAVCRRRRRSAVCRRRGHGAVRSRRRGHFRGPDDQIDYQTDPGSKYHYYEPQGPAHAAALGIAVHPYGDQYSDDEHDRYAEEISCEQELQLIGQHPRGQNLFGYLKHSSSPSLLNRSWIFKCRDGR